MYNQNLTEQAVSAEYARNAAVPKCTLILFQIMKVFRYRLSVINRKFF